jgi:hypothetical protein
VPSRIIPNIHVVLKAENDVLLVELLLHHIYRAKPWSVQGIWLSYCIIGVAR